MAEAFDVYLIAIRWTHFVFGITWIGLLYYFNFVQIPAFKELDASTKNVLIPKLVKRALFWFRWAALITVAAGWLYFVSILGFAPERAGTSWQISIWAGGILGTMMFINVWGIIWVHQKRIIAATEGVLQGKPAPPEMPVWGKRATIASRWNTAISFPMLFFMGAASHLPLL